MAVVQHVRRAQGGCAPFRPKQKRKSSLGEAMGGASFGVCVGMCVCVYVFVLEGAALSVVGKLKGNSRMFGPSGGSCLGFR